ncbi:MAG: hypothetical protein DHS20C18_27540 [Saprospiraceae bacterium]|nr:MAG: hypothetical protein DHS20C18_27540 [Saprospiraceae bacterium]
MKEHLCTDLSTPWSKCGHNPFKIVFFIAGLLGSFSGWGQIYTYTDASDGSYSSISTNMTATALSRGTGLGATANCIGLNDGFAADEWPTTGVDIALSNTNGDYIEFTITPDVGYFFNITGFTAMLRRSNPAGITADGPTIVRYAYSTDGATFTESSNRTPGANTNCTNTGGNRNWNGFTEISTSDAVIFRIYGFNGGTDGTGDLILRSVVVSGFVYSPSFFRSKASGDWNMATTWESSPDEMTWNDATNPPTIHDHTITIQNSHMVTVTADAAIDEVIINSGGQVNVNSGQTLTIEDGTGTDLTVNGILRNAGVLTTTGTLSFGSDGTYIHDRNGNNLPIATWDAASTCNITGIIGNRPGNTNQTFGNVIWNCPDMTSNLNFPYNNMVIAGDFDIISTGGGANQIQLNQTLLTIGGNFNQGGGNFRLGNNTNRTITVSGDFSLSGGMLDMSSGGNANDLGTLNVAGDFSHTAGTLVVTGNGTGVINFTGNGAYLGGGTITASSTINYDINAGATMSFATADLSASDGTFVNNGTLMGEGTLTIPTGGTAALVNNGTVAPGNSIGTLTINGDFTNEAAGTVEIELTGTSGDNDVLVVSGEANLDGTLNVVQIGGTIDLGDAYNAITWTSLVGSFATVNLPGGAMNWMPSPIYNINQLSLVYSSATPLPIELISFTGKRVHQTIALEWATASELNNDFMAVERSEDGLRFKEIGTIKGAGTTHERQNYSFIDETPVRGANYYRLRQVDFDGRAQYHKVINVDFADKQPGISIQVYPNPANEQISVSWNTETREVGLIQIFNLTGQLMATYQIPRDRDTYEIPLQQLPANNYLLVWTQGNQKETIRFVKQ